MISFQPRRCSHCFIGQVMQRRKMNTYELGMGDRVNLNSVGSTQSAPFSDYPAINLIDPS